MNGNRIRNYISKHGGGQDQVELLKRRLYFLVSITILYGNINKSVEDFLEGDQVQWALRKILLNLSPFENSANSVGLCLYLGPFFFFCFGPLHVVNSLSSPFFFGGILPLFCFCEFVLGLLDSRQIFPCSKVIDL